MTRMVDADGYLSTLPLKQSFHDAHEHRAYLRTIEVARRLLTDPRLVANGKRYLERFVRGDPAQVFYYELWQEVLAGEPRDIVRRLLADTEEGMDLRDSSPVFVRLLPSDLKAIWTRAGVS